MKKTIFGSALMLGGVIGFAGWINAGATLSGQSSYSILENLNSSDVIVAFGFIAIAIAGAVIAISSFKEDK